MKFDITKAKFIPQSNVRSESKLTLESLLTYTPKPAPIEYDLVLLKNGSWKIADKFVEGQKENEGFTASLVEGNVFLIKGNETLSQELTPKFLNGTGTIFKSAYFSFLIASSDLKNNTEFFLEEGESGIDGVKAYLLITEAPVVKETPQVLTAEKLAQLETPVPQVEVPAVEHTQEELDAAKEYYEKMNEEILPTENVVFEEAVAEDVPVTEIPVVPAKQDYTEEPVDDIF